MPTILGREIAPVGYGLMGLTRPVDPIRKEEAFAAMNAALENGANYWNGGEFYGTEEWNSLTLLRDYFTKYPEKASKVVLAIKGSRIPGSIEMDCSEAGIMRSVNECLRILGGTKSLDIFECARVDRNVPVEESIRVLARCVKEGKIKGIGLSEVKADTIRRAAKVHPIAQVEVELSLWSTNILHNDIAKTAAELGLPIIAYAPLSRGGLTASVVGKNPDDLPPHLKIFPRFQGETLAANLRLTQEVERLAAKKGVSTPQIALSWIRSLSGRNGLGVIIPIPGAERPEWVIENMKAVTLTPEELSELDNIVSKVPIQGTRYFGDAEKMNEG